MATANLRPAGILFDLDGTLADSFAAIAAALNRALREEGLPEWDLDWVRRHVGRGAVELVRDAAGGDELAMRAVGRRFAERYREIYLEQTPPMPGALEVVAYVAGRTGGKVGVVSNKYAELCRGWLDHWGFSPFVGAVSGPEASGARKPDPRAVLPVLRKLGVSPAEALLVGDMPIDVATGKACGIPVLAVEGGAATAQELGEAGALAVLGSITDLRGWLAEHGEGWTGAG